MNKKYYSILKGAASVFLGAVMSVGLVGSAGAQTVPAASSTVAARPGFIEFNNLAILSISGTSTPATIQATGTPASNCILFGVNAMNSNGKTIACPAGSPYSLVINAGAQMYSRGKNPASLSDFVTGDTVDAFGYYDPTTDTVQTSLLRDLSGITLSGGDPVGTSTVADLTLGQTIDNAAPQAGGTVNYLVTVSALGSATSTGVIVTDMLPAGLTFLSDTPSTGSYDSSTGAWSIGAMPSGGTATLGIQAQTDASDTTGQVITNAAAATEDSSLTNNDVAQASSSVALTIAGSSTTSTPPSTVAGLTVMNSASTMSPQPGGSLTYTLTVSALGPATSTGVMATDILPSDLTLVSATPSMGTYNSSTGAWSIGTLTPDATATLAIAADVSQFAPANQTITDMATVGEDPTLTNPNTTQASSQVTVVIASNIISSSTADLAVTNNVDAMTPQAGTTVNYTVTATDLGPASSTGVIVTDMLPAGLTFLSDTPSTGSYDSSTGAWSIGTLTPDATATLAIVATVNASDTAGQAITNTATGSESNPIPDPNPANSTASTNLTVTTTTVTTATSTAGLEITKTIDDDAPQAGSEVNYTITVSALGPASSTDVVVNDVMPAGLTFLSDALSTGSFSTSTGAWSIGTLTPDATATMTVDAMVNSSDTADQAITNTASVTEDPSLVNPDSDEAMASAILSVAAPSSTVTTSTPTSTLPGTLSIDPSGDFLSRSMTVTSVGSSSFQAQIWGITYTFNWTGNAGDEFLFRNGDQPFNFNSNGSRFSDQIAVGDMVDVSGTVTPSNPFIVTANVVRNNSITSARPPHPYYPYGNNGNAGNSGNGNGSSSFGNGSSGTEFQNQLNSLSQELQQLESEFQNSFNR